MHRVSVSGDTVLSDHQKDKSHERSTEIYSAPSSI